MEHKIAGEYVTAKASPLLMVIESPDYPQSFDCPDCGQVVRWGEVGYTPGHRICSGCDSHFSCQPAGSVEAETVEGSQCACGGQYRYYPGDGHRCRDCGSFWVEDLRRVRYEVRRAEFY